MWRRVCGYRVTVAPLSTHSTGGRDGDGLMAPLTRSFSVLKASYKLLDFIHFVLNQPPVESVFASAQRSFQWELYSLPHDCHLPRAQPPRVTVALAAGALQLLAGATLVLQAYAWRLRHAIAASFFPAQEARRVSHLKDRLQRRHDRSDRLDRQACTMGTWEPREAVQGTRAPESQGPQSLGPSLASV